ncbi:protein adenylyltransferase SelO [Uliginosibacterium gangwonense]|uniref:protein adenylyltransferase SelO n=1 Tax=Uliginosibacterium gangwonense TaxID=392736 RepID=UPI0003686E52|nr:YdiU family protein [Uliginosibacterium gangwonense]
MRIAFDNTYAHELQGLYAPCQPYQVAAPSLVFWNQALANELGLAVEDADIPSLPAVFSGNVLPQGATPIAQAYAGHQFGQLSPSLGDGRALLIGEVLDCQHRRRDIAFKGSGRTPFSRNGDGKAALGPMLREVLLGEAMHALSIPTTRALAVVSTGEVVYRDQVLPGAVLTRVAASHIRVGTFEYFAARGELESLKRLAAYTITRHTPQLQAPQLHWLDFLREVSQRQAALIAQWMSIGFIHGVMNTDNMTISGETIDYGPCAFMEAYDPHTVFSSIDHQGRYAFGNQPHIAQWNLARLAEALLPLSEMPPEQTLAEAEAVINSFPNMYHQQWLKNMRAKLGLSSANDEADSADEMLAQDWLELLQVNKVDFTLGWRYLADAAEGDESRLRNLFADQSALSIWLARWHARLHAEETPSATRANSMRQHNPWLIPRNHRVEEALAAAINGELAPFEKLLAALKSPYQETALYADYAEPAPEEMTMNYQTFCGT